MNSIDPIPWLDSETATSIAGNRAGFEALEAGIVALLDLNEDRNEIALDGFQLETLVLLNDPRDPSDKKFPIELKIILGFLLTIVAIVLVLACFGLMHLWNIIFN